ncbi:hypothetical protein Ahy_B01g055279 [Arachis hypogaea]|uniref:RNase H type-1 domain-containing protein n=1 Tax=Arachis hypogaea TaxID=3818 RepID=A0A445AVV8_ARAHY|nr:hypothetical protein Ahy_B01g055279 [Arachis hypogaea]
MVSGLTTTFKSTSCLAAEAQAYREALILIKNIQLEKCIIETDCLPLVQAIKAKTSLAEADAIIRDILHLLNEAPDVGVTWTPRDGNNLAHQLAAMAAGNGFQRQWIVNPPAQIKNTIRTEVGFATLQQEQNIQNHTNLVPISTSHQRQHREEILPGRVGVEPGESEEAGVDDQTRAFGGATGGDDRSYHRAGVGLSLEKWAKHLRENRTTCALERGSNKPGEAQMATIEDEEQPSQSRGHTASMTLRNQQLQNLTEATYEGLGARFIHMQQ